MSVRKYASAEVDSVIRSTKGRTAAVKAGGFEFEPKEGMLYATVRAISARVNRNFDGFPSVELRKAAHTFTDRPVFVNHNNTDEKRTRGIILKSEYKESGNDKYIELLIEVDAKNFPKLASKIESGEIDAVSMGTDCTYTKCSACDNVAYNWADFCEHIPAMKGKTATREDGTDVLVYESCHGLNFFEISFVFDPADETATLTNVITAGKKEAYGETIAPEDVDTLRQEEPCPQCGQLVDDRLCPMCGYEKPIGALGDPDTSVAGEVDLRQDSGDEEVEVAEDGDIDPNQDTDLGAGEDAPGSVDKSQLGNRLPTLETQDQDKEDSSDDESEDDKDDTVPDKDDDDKKKKAKLAYRASQIRKQLKVASEAEPTQPSGPDQPDGPEEPTSDYDWDGDEELRQASVEDIVLVAYKTGSRWTGEVIDEDGVLISQLFKSASEAQTFAEEFATDVVKLAI